MDTLDSSGSSAATKMPNLPSSMPDYLAHFGLRSDPFAVADFYQGAGRQSLLENLHHQVLFGAGLLVVGAAEGVGKTRLCAQLQKSFDDIPANVCSLSLQEGVTLQSFVAELALMLGVSSLASVPLGQALSELRRHLQARREDGSLSVLLIDDAHHLDDQSLATLVGLLQGQAELDRSVCVVLFAEPNFLGRLAVTDIGDLLLHDILLEAFDLNDLRAYLQWRFQQVGDDAFPYKNSDLEGWLLECAGNLTHIHQRAQRWMLESVSVADAVGVADDVPPLAQADPQSTLKQLPLLHIGAIVLLSSVLLSAYMLRGDTQDQLAVANAGDGTKLEFNEPELASIDEGIDALPMELELVATEKVAVKEVLLPEPAADLNRSAEVASKEPKGIAVEPPAPSIAEKEPVEVSVVEKMVEPAVEQVVEPRAQLKAEPEAEKALVILTVDEEKLLALKNQQYLLQIMAASSRTSVEKFVSQQPNRKNLYVFSSKRQGADWFVVVAGPYESIGVARAAVTRLPSGQREAGPWPRSVADVQSKIRENSRI